MMELSFGWHPTANFVQTRHKYGKGKSPKELMTGEKHPHWLEMLGFERFQRG
jgi:hypothetical protein